TQQAEQTIRLGSYVRGRIGILSYAAFFHLGHIAGATTRCEGAPAIHIRRLLYSPACLLLRKNCFSWMRWRTFTALFLRPCRSASRVPAASPRTSPFCLETL